MADPRWRERLATVRRRLRPRSRLVAALALARRRRLGARTLHNALLDLRFGGLSGGRVANPFADRGATPVQSTDYAALTRVYRRNDIRVAPDDVLVDVGCGRGRAINWWLHQGLRNPVVGVELVEAVAEEARRRLRRHPGVRIVTGDAVALLPPEGTFFYLYNPFDAPVMERFAERVLATAARPDRVRILYFNCRQVEVFRRDPRWTVRMLDTGEPEPAALIRPAAAAPPR